MQWTMLLYTISHPISEKYFLAEDVHYYRKLELVGIQMVSGYFLSYKTWKICAYVSTENWR